MSMQFSGKHFTFTQPDGTPLEVRGWGDQHAALFRTLDGHPVVKNIDTGFYEYATVEAGHHLRPAGRDLHAPLLATRDFSAGEAKALTLSNPGLYPGSTRWRVRSERRRLARAAPIKLDGIHAAPPDRGTVGKFVGLCLLVEFPDVPATISKEEVESFLNKPGYDGFGNAGSVRDYFLDVSGQKLDYSGIVAPYYRAKKPRAYYTDETIPQPRRAYELIAEALTSLKQSGFDFSQLSVDDEQYIYAINVYYAGPVVNNWAQGLWPHSHHLATPVELQPGSKAYDYQFTSMGPELTLGTFCHENGHMICDFPDLYDYGYESAGVGTYCLMCAGGNADPRNPGHVGAYLKYRAGWAHSVTRITTPQEGRLAAGSNDFYLFERTPQEYFILEHRQRAGRDVALPDSGLAIWHVDERGDNSNEQGTAAIHYECSLEQADGRADLEHNRNQGDRDDLYPGNGNDKFSDDSRPSSRWWSGKRSGLTIEKIAKAGQHVTFVVRV